MVPLRGRGGVFCHLNFSLLYMCIIKFIPGKLSWVSNIFRIGNTEQNGTLICKLGFNTNWTYFIQFHLVLSLTFRAELHSALQAEGLPFELVCYIKGTPDEIKDHKIVWEGPDINEDKIIRIKGNDNNGIITVTKSETPAFLFNCCLMFNHSACFIISGFVIPY